MEKVIKLPQNGYAHLFLAIIMLLSPLLLFWFPILALGICTGILFLLSIFWFAGLMVINPNQSRVLTLFGKYKGTVKENGFFWVNPFYVKRKISLRVHNLETDFIKVNDLLGNPIIISAIVVWKVIDTYKAAFVIENSSETNPKTGLPMYTSKAFERFVKIQVEAALRKLAHSYPYDDFDEHESTICLRSGVDEINKALEEEIRERLIIAGIDIQEARLSNLSYAPEIASAMLQRQQAQAVISARTKIVDGAVGMVEMALDKLSKREIVHLDEEKKAAMVSNLLVVLCSDHAAKPVINAGTLHQ